MGMEHRNPDEILQQAVEIIDPTERAAYLEQVCAADETLRAEIESLLKAHQEAGTFLNAPALEPEVSLTLTGPAEGPGTVIGHYKLLERIGEGGMATVYMAEQEQPVRRKVALKIIKLGMDTKNVIARFEAERQALAMMDHPNIAKVFDGGATDTGRPYFVMELVRGVSITEYCDKNDFNTRQRLDLFVQVCHAVQHAHQKGIIHRDIKPSNVLVTLRDGTPVPKVIDFGIAKATNQRLTEKTVFTRFAQMIGTPAYMSPEQAQMSELDVDTRTDVYSLGVLLYELLTGSTPFDADQLCQAGYAGIQRIIRETEPVKPSTRLSTLGQSLSDVAQHRQTAPEMLPRLVRGDLDWIVMKTLEKDRTHRYETAHALAEDVERHLKHEPVTAGRPGPLHRCRKFVQRHRALVVGAASVLIVLCAGVVVSTCFAVRLRSTVRELREEQEARRQLENERHLSIARRLYEEGRFQEASDEVEFYTKSGGSAPEAHLIHARSLYAVNRPQDAAEELETLLTQSPPDEIAGEAHHLLGIILVSIDSGRAEKHRRFGESSLPKTAEDCYLRAQVATTLAESVDWLSRALDLDPGYYPARKSRALAYYGLRDFEKMARDADSLIVLRQGDSLGYALRAIVRRQNGLIDEALEDHSLAIRLCQTTAMLAELYDQRRTTYVRAGDHLSELQDAKRCAELAPDEFDYQFNLFVAFLSLRNYEAALEQYRAILEADPGSQESLVDQTRKHVFDTLGAGETLKIPEEFLSEPVFSAIQEAIESYGSLLSKAQRLVPNVSARMSWSPDSRYLAYGRSERYVSDLGMRATPAEFLSSGIEILEVESGDTRLLASFGKDPAWSPDGEYIAFVRGPVDTGGAMEEVWIAPARGGDPRQVAVGGLPHWTADSTRVIFQSRIDNTLCSVDITDPNAEPETIVACPEWYPAISPGGRYVAYYLDDRLTIFELATGTVVARCPRPVPPGGFIMNWSPDGRELSLGDEHVGLWVYNVERQEGRQVLEAPAVQGAWSPDKSRMGVLVHYPPYDEIWLATLDPNKPTWASLAPVLTWEDYVQNKCERCRRLVARCPVEAAGYLDELAQFGVSQYSTGEYQDTVSALTTVDELRRTIPPSASSAAEISLLAQAWHGLERDAEAQACLDRLRQLFRQGTLLHGQQYMYEAERALAAEDDHLSSLWRDLEMGQLAAGAQELSNWKTDERQDTWTRGRMAGLGCALAMRYCARAKSHVADSNAVADYEAAIACDPNYVPALCDLAWLEASSCDPEVRDCNQAMKHVTQACELTAWESHVCLSTMAAVCANAGDFEAAERWQREAIALLRDPLESEEKHLYRDNLRHYQGHWCKADGLTWEKDTDMLVARWAFDEGRGPVAHDSKGANDGTLHGDPAWTAGRLGGALQFDGAGDHVNCGDSPVFDLADEITVAAWVKVTAFSTPIQAVITKGDGSWRLQRSGSALCFHCNLQSGSLLAADGSTPVIDGGWHHVVGVFDGDNAHLYVDGVLDGRASRLYPDDAPVTSPSPTPGRLATSAYPVWIGDNAEAPGNEWYGLIDDVRIYACALGAEDIAALALAGGVTMSTPSGLVSYWPGDGNGRDVIGANHADVAAGNVAFAPGQASQAFHFGADSHTFVAPGVGISNLQQFTLALWVRLDSLPQEEIRSFVCIGNEKAVLRYDGGPLHYYTKNTDSVIHHIWVNDAFVEGAFYHVAGTYDGRTMRLYFDGIEVGTCETTGNLTVDENDDVELGWDNLDGFLDEIQIYNRALSAAEVTALARSPRMPTGGLSTMTDGPSLVEADHVVGTTNYGFTRSDNTFVPGPVDQVAQGPQVTDVVDLSASQSGPAPVAAPAQGIADLQQLSIALWVKLDSMRPSEIQRFITLGDEKAVLRYDGLAGSRQLHFYMRTNERTLHDVRANGLLSIGVFHHVVGTYDGHTMRLFYDGVQVGSCEVTGLSVRGYSVEFSQRDEALHGTLDEVQIYDRALSADEIHELYSSDVATIPTGGPGPITWWNFDAISRTTALDCVGSNHATVYQATWVPGRFGSALHFDRDDSTEMH